MAFIQILYRVQEWLKHSLDFASFVASQESRPECCGLVLSSLLILPIQRVPRSVFAYFTELIDLKLLITPVCLLH